MTECFSSPKKSLHLKNWDGSYCPFLFHQHKEAVECIYPGSSHGGEYEGMFNHVHSDHSPKWCTVQVIYHLISCLYKVCHKVNSSCLFLFPIYSQACHFTNAHSAALIVVIREIWCLITFFQI